MLGGSKKLITLDELPILPARLRALVNLSQIRYARRYIKLPLESLRQLDSGYELAYQLLRVNFPLVCTIQLLSVVTAAMYYAPIAFIQFFLEYIEADPQRKDTSWGWFYVTGIFAAHFVVILSNAQLLWLSNNNLRTNLSLQLNTLLYTKTMVRKDVPSNANTSSSDESGPSTDFSSKAKVMTLMTTDVGRARELSRLIFSLTDAAIGISIGTYMLYKLLGVSTFVGLGITFLMTPLNQLAGHSVVYLQKMIMSCRDERVALTNEFLGAIRMIKFMAWERSFEKRILAVRMRELKYQKKIFILQTLWDSLGNSIPLMFALGCFGHFTVIRGEDLTPSIAFTAIVIFGQIKYNFNGLPEFFVAALQAFVSLRRIEKYLYVAEVRPHSKGQHQRVHDVAFQSATVGWPQIRTTVSESETPGNGFSLIGINTTFPRGELSLVCGKIGSGKTLLLLALLGEADVLAGQVLCPRSVPDSYSSLSEVDDLVPWIMDGICAYVPQTPWLRNQSIKENILFGLPYDSERYEAVLEACALVHDLNVLEDGDECEVGEHGINLSGGQKARISLARAVYSRASILLLDDVLSAVDAHTAHHLWSHCFKSALMHHRTTILVSHHIQLCGPDSKLIVALDGGRVRFSGSWPKFQRSDVMSSILASNPAPKEDTENVEEITTVLLVEPASQGQPNKATIVNGKLPATKKDGEKAHKLPKEEKRFEGRISRDVWLLYIRANGNLWFWLVLWVALLVSSLSPVWEKGWLKIWSSSGDPPQKAGFFLGIYAGIVTLEIATKIVRWLIIFSGSIHASKVLYEKLLETVLFANIQFHDTTSRGRVLNRFGKDFEAVDNELPNELGRALMIAMSVILTISTLTFVGGLPLFIASLLFLGIAFLIAQMFGRVARDIRRLSSVTSSPLFSIYGETISGLTVIRAFGMPTKFLKDMIICADTNMNPSYWVVGLNRWLNVRFQMITGALIGILALIILLNPSIDASWAGLALAFASTLTLDLYWLIRRWVDVEQTMVALERIKEYSDLPTEAPEYIEPRPPAAWPTSGSIQFENISVRYAAELPDVLHGLTFEVKPGEKVGLIGRTGSGKSTVGLALLRFVEAREGRILIDGVNIAKIGLTDLRSRLTIVPQDPVLLSGTLRSTLDIFGEYDDAGLYEALRRVNLLKPSGPDQSQSSIFANLDTPVSELGDNFSTGEKQLLCMARALLRRSKVLVMDEATASVDYATDEIISRTIREEFADSTIVTIAHRLRTVIDYDRIMVMDEGQIVEFDSPGLLINNEGSRFHKLCKAAGIEEFAKLNAMVH